MWIPGVLSVLCGIEAGSDLVPWKRPLCMVRSTPAAVWLPPALEASPIAVNYRKQPRTLASQLQAQATRTCGLCLHMLHSWSPSCRQTREIEVPDAGKASSDTQALSAKGARVCLEEVFMFSYSQRVQVTKHEKDQVFHGGIRCQILCLEWLLGLVPSYLGTWTVLDLPLCMYFVYAHEPFG